ncbi:MAG TPA: tetratricopeptide repeat protein [Chitinophagaceae bacterium]|nr:tetratricopeptide repeat protein [Chitinophagaceae bacterium]
MIRFANIISGLIAGMILLSSCNDKKDDSPFAEIFSRPSYKGLTDSIRQDPTRDDLYFRRAVLLNKDDFPEPALADFRKAWALKKEEKYAFGISTILLGKNPDSAIVFLDQALRELPQSVLLGISLSRAYEAQNRTKEALEIANAILEKHPEQVDLLKIKAELLAKTGDGEAAVSTLEKAYALTPFDIELNHMLAFRYAETKNRRVLDLCDSLIRMDSLGIHADPYYYKGIYYSNINDKKKALALFDEAIRHDYNFLDAHIEKGIVLFEQKKFNDAYTAFNLAMTISPKYADAYYWMAKSQQAMGQKEEARLNYLRAYGLDKSLAQAKAAADSLDK